MSHLHIIQANFGDCLLLEVGDPPRYLLIDGGPKATYASALRPVLAEIAGKGGRLSGVILTHPDNDHVEGLVEFFTELWMQKASGEPPLIAVDAVWLNSFRFDAEAPTLQAILLPMLPADVPDATAEPMLLEGVQERNVSITMRHESQKTTDERTCRSGNHSAGQLCSGARQCQGLRKSAYSRRPLTPPARRKSRPVTL